LVTQPLDLVFMGTPEFAATILAGLIAAGHGIRAVYTQPPRPAGRGHRTQPSPVQLLAESHGLAVHCPASLRDAEAQAEFAAIGADAAVVAAYGLILPSLILATPHLGCLNVHASLLPRWRGAAPINRAIMAGDAETGIMVMKMEETLDTGPIAMAERVTIGADATAGDLHDELARLGADLALRALGGLERGALTLTPQPQAGVTYADKIEKEEARIDWSKPWKHVHDHIRGLSPHPGAWFDLAGARVKVLRTTKGEGGGAPGTVLDDRLTIACGEGALCILQLQRAGRQPMAVEEFLRGTKIASGAVLG
jgi:methionyl-tRNA formyltransferase